MTIEIAQIISRAWASKRPDETVSAWTCKWGGLVADRPADIYLFKVNKKKSRKRCELWTYFTLFSSVLIVAFEQVNVSWTVYLKTSLIQQLCTLKSILQTVSFKQFI